VIYLLWPIQADDRAGAVLAGTGPWHPLDGVALDWKPRRSDLRTIIVEEHHFALEYVTKKLAEKK